jgi:polysaccharide export outer membrane protein
VSDPAGAGVDPTAFTALASGNVSAAAAVPGTLSPGDLLDISVFQVPDLTREEQIDADGQISLPLIGEMKAAGETPRALEAEIAAKLKAKYMQSPQVTVFLKKASGEQVSVSGEVYKPGVYTIAGQMTLVQALAQAGDINQTGDSSAVHVFRQGNGGRMEAKFNVDDIRSGKAPDPPLYPGDMVVVDSSGARSAWKSFEEVLPAVGTAGVVAVTAVK